MAATAGTARHSLVLEHAMRPMFAYLKAVTVPTGVFAASEDWGPAAPSSRAVRRIDVAAAELADLVDRAAAVRPARPGSTSSPTRCRSSSCSPADAAWRHGGPAPRTPFRQRPAVELLSGRAEGSAGPNTS